MEDYKEKFEKIYEKQGVAPWTFRDPPKELVHLVESKKILPCRVLDIGCGEGSLACAAQEWKNGYLKTTHDYLVKAVSML